MKRKDYTNQRFGRLTVVEMLYGYRNKQTYARCVCDCGQETIAYMGNIVKGATTSCGCWETQSRYGRQNHEKDISGKRFGHLEILRKTNKKYANGNVGWLCKCDCGNEVVVRSGNLLRGKTRSCGCNRRSKYEEFVEAYLISANIDYDCEHRFPDCKNHFMLPFDFYLPNHNGLNYCIEVQGQHHYEPIKGWRGEDGFRDIQRNDSIKRDYCKNNNIILIELPYTLKESEIIHKLDSILNPVTTTAA
jgi:hypothetical protein